MNNIHDYEPLWGAWRVEDLIGEGSYGKVYRVVKEEFGKKYYAAVKIISIPENEGDIQQMRSEGLSDSSVRSFFHSCVADITQEIDLMSELRGNSNIVSFEDHKVITKSKEFGWDILIRMELLRSLTNRLADGPLPQEEVIKLGIDICRALELCALHNTVHRDVKPDNIFISDYGDYKLGDFGIARQIERSMSMSKKGTYTYMAPEVFKGEKYGINVDTYSLGIVMYRLLNQNRTPFLPAFPKPITPEERETALQRRMGGEPLPIIAGVSPVLSAIVLRACAYDRKVRFANPTEMRKALEDILGEKDHKYDNRNRKSTGVVAGESAKQLERQEPAATARTAHMPSAKGSATENLENFHKPSIREKKVRVFTWAGSIFAVVVLLLIFYVVWNKSMYQSSDALEANAPASTATVSPTVPSSIATADSSSLATTLSPTFTPEPTETSEPTSTPSMPVDYVAIYTPKDLDNIRNDLSGKFILMNDIDLTSYSNWTPIGQSDTDAFSGVLDGNGYAIINLKIYFTNYQGGFNAGLFGVIINGTVLNLGLENTDIDISGTGTDAFIDAGSIAGIVHSTTIKNCFNTGRIRTFTTGSAYARSGGLVTSAVDNSVIMNCYNTGLVISSTDSNRNAMAGGIVAWLDSGASVSFCYNSGDVSSSSGDKISYVAGICASGDSQVDNCVVLSQTIDGIYKSALISNFGSKSNNLALGSINGNFTDDANRHISASESKSQSTYEAINWDFENVWAISANTNNGYPYLIINN